MPNCFFQTSYLIIIILGLKPIFHQLNGTMIHVWLTYICNYTIKCTFPNACNPQIWIIWCTYHDDIPWQIYRYAPIAPWFVNLKGLYANACASQRSQPIVAPAPRGMQNAALGAPAPVIPQAKAGAKGKAKPKADPKNRAVPKAKTPQQEATHVVQLNINGAFTIVSGSMHVI